jgi:hypothetical protein
MEILFALTLLFSQSAPSAEGTIDIIQFGFIGVALIWFSLGKVHPDSTVKELRTQLAKKEEQLAAESADSKAVRDAIIKDVAPVMARVADRDKEVVELVTKLLAWAVEQRGTS